MIKYQGKSIVSLAHERGANGNLKNKAKAWQYLLGAISVNDRPIHARGQHISAYNIKHYGYSCGIYNRTIRSAADYKRYMWEQRIERTGDSLCHAHGYQLRTEIPGELLPHHIKYREQMIATIDKSMRYTYSLSTLPREPQEWNDPDYYLCIAGRTIILHRADSASWDNSASSHWPSSKSISRTAYLLREGWDDLSKDGLLANAQAAQHGLAGLSERKISYEARGNWLPKIIIDLLGITPQRQRELAHIQLDPHYRVSLKRKIAGIEIWQRTLAGEIIDYCAVRGKDTYHASTQSEAVKGLAAKLATPGSRREVIDMDYALSLGFCRTGVEQFCADYGLNCTCAYRRSEVQALIVSGNGRAKKYERELVKAGFTV